MAALETEPVSAGPRIVRRYGGSRLYDAQRPSYVSIDQVRHMMREDEGVIVMDAGTGEDVTLAVLSRG